MLEVYDRGKLDRYLILCNCVGSTDYLEHFIELFPDKELIIVQNVYKRSFNVIELDNFTLDKDDADFVISILRKFKIDYLATYGDNMTWLTILLRRNRMSFKDWIRVLFSRKVTIDIDLRHSHVWINDIFYEERRS